MTPDMLLKAFTRDGSHCDLYTGDENNLVLSHKYRLVSTCCSLVLFTHGFEQTVLVNLKVAFSHTCCGDY
jgi:hypothetical protein